MGSTHPPASQSGPEPETALVPRSAAAARTRVLVLWDGGSAVAEIAPGGQVVVGRSRECDLVVNHDSISRRHVAVRDGGGGPPTVEELGSSNGTRIDGAPLAPGREVPLEPRATIEIGSCTMFVQSPQAPAQATSEAPGGMERVRKLIELVGPSDISVLLMGETGTGKEVAAERIHARSPRAKGPLVKINCAAFPEELLESELFGHERGAFTGAVATKPGLFETAHGGTLFLDEVGELASSLQAKLLRVFETREVRRVGATQGRKVDVRLVSATNRDLPALCEEGAFRADLYYRLNGITIRLPPLRERPGEVVPLAELFLADAARGRGIAPLPLGADARAALARHSWPGNIRELKHAIELAVVLSDGNPILPEHLDLAKDQRSPSGVPGTLKGSLDDAARRAVVDALERTQGNQTQAAKLLGITRRALIYRMEEFGLPRARKAR